jgi:ribosomal-protein-alanine N-acetyltransferase
MQPSFAQGGSLPDLDTRIATERLVLRPPRTSDVKAIALSMKQNADHLAPWSPEGSYGPNARTPRAIAEKIVEQRKLWKLDRGYAFLVFTKNDEKTVIGRVQLNGIMRGVFQNAYLGYWMAKTLEGRGLMTEAVGGAIGWAFEALRLHRVQAAVIPHNGRSIRVLEKLGFRREGLAERYLQIAGKWQDHVIFAVTREDWVSGSRGRAPGARAAAPPSRNRV